MYCTGSAKGKKGTFWAGKSCVYLTTYKLEDKEK